jgi:hypothetical protein
MVDLGANGLKEAELESVSSLDADAQIRKDEEALVRAVNVLQMVEAGDTAACRVPCLAIRQKVKLLVLLGIGQHGAHEVAGVLQIPSLVFPSLSFPCDHRLSSTYLRKVGVPWSWWLDVCL